VPSSLGHYSTVTIELSEGRKGCDMKLTQVGVPEAEAERTQQAWRENIFERLKRMFGYGMGYSPF
jgi:activator of HSP90 ATPase